MSTDSLTAYGQFLYNKTTATGQVGWSPTLFVVPTMPATNPFIPADLATDPRIASDAGRGLHAQPALHGRWTTASSRPTSRRGSTSSACAANCRSRTGAGTSTVRTTPPTSSRRRTRRSLNSRMRNLLYAADGGASICAGGFNPFGLANSNEHLRRVPRVHRSRDARLHAAFANHLRSQPDRRPVRHARGRSALRVDAGQARQRLRVRSGSVAREPGHHRHAADVSRRKARRT